MSQMQANPFDDESHPFYVLINDEAQYSLWPAFAALPAGWRATFGPEPRPACIGYIEAHWQDMRPRTLQNADR